MTENNDSRYVYKNLRPAAISVEQLDALINFVINSPKSYIGAIIAGIKVTLVLAYIFARRALVKSEQEYALQQYRQSQDAGNQDQIDQDDLSGERKNNVTPHE